MALRFALLRDYHRGDPTSFRSRTQFEVFFIDLDTEEELVRFLRRPEVARFSQQVLAPLRDQVMQIRDRFHLAPPRSARLALGPFPDLRLYALPGPQSFIRQAIVPDERGVIAKRIPTPSVTSLLYMMRLVRRFGFEGDDEATRASSAEDDLLVVFNHAHETIFGMATRLASSQIVFSHTLSKIQMTPAQGVLSCAPLLSVRVTNLDHEPDMDSPRLDPVATPSESDSVCLVEVPQHPSSLLMDLPVIDERGEDGASPHTTEELTRIPEALQLLLGPYRSLLPDPREYGEDCHGLLRYFEEVVGPYAQLIDKAFPTRVIVKHQMRPESVEFLSPHVGELLRFLGLAYVIALEIVSNYGPPILFPTEAIRTLSLMQKFDGILGSPTYEVGPALQSIIMSWLKLMIGCVRQRRLSYTDPIDIPPVRDLAHVPCVPSWTVEEIATLQAEEHNDPWVAEKYWLRERVEACNRAGKELSDVLADVAGAECIKRFLTLDSSSTEFFLMSSVPITQTSDLLAKLHSILPPATGSRMEPSLRALWVSQIRNLCQGIHETIASSCTAVKILLSNMVLIGATKISVESDPSNPLQYYVPGFGTLVFAMAEQFVILCGYEGDEDVASRESIFGAVALIQHAMVIHPAYATTPVEAPGYSSAQADPFFYGIGTHTKERQVQEILEHGHLLHRFGENLLRYDHTLGSQAYHPPTCPPEERIFGSTSPSLRSIFHACLMVEIDLSCVACCSSVG
ncbi:hypothetical protein B0H16DRAFT_1460134 [Mycena metata]|uniref:Uncharacterized protein n=1 Tax=Mycena metata TaxID=1033252 RepID=A0AAD7J002_9AGAR|nr:hypothetical protein B0H16DRAFT_1460134 [Mycena metata]